MTHKLENNYTTEVLPQEGEPHISIYSLGFWQQEKKPPENLALKASLITGIPQDWGNRNSTLGGHTQGLMRTRTQGKKQ